MRWWHRRTEPMPETGLNVIVGLGNPGGQYRRTRHNVGFMVAERLADRHGLRLSGSKLRADVANGSISGRAVLVAEPLTYMNESGEAVARLLRYYKVPPARLIVIADDLDLPFGTIRIRPSGSAAGQKGLQSIIERLGTNEFPRLRVGIGRPTGQTVPYVLQPFTDEEVARLPGLIDTACDGLEALLLDGPLEAMNRFNRSWIAPAS